MKRVVVICLLMFGVALSAHAQSDESRVTPGIKSVRTERADFQNGVEGARRLVSEATYDADGDIVESTVYDEKGTLYAKYVARYGADGGLLEETYTEAKGEVGAHYLVHADLTAKRLEVVNTKPQGGNAAKVVSTLDDAGDVIEETTFDKTDKPVRRVTIKRNAQGQRLEALHYDAKNQLSSREVNNYSAGRLSESLTYDGAGNVVERHLYRYDAKGNVVEETFYNVGGASQWRYAYVYDAQGNWVTKSMTRLVKKNEQLVHEPSEILFRTITYETSAMPAQSKPRPLPVYNSAARSSFQGMAVKRTEPVYPDLARRLRVSGEVKVQVVVDEQGRVLSSKALPAGDPHLKPAAEAAAWYWTFSPTLRSGLPTRVIGTLTFNFHL
jgi:TonB family protein